MALTKRAIEPKVVSLRNTGVEKKNVLPVESKHGCFAEDLAGVGVGGAGAYCTIENVGSGPLPHCGSLWCSVLADLCSCRAAMVSLMPIRMLVKSWMYSGFRGIQLRKESMELAAQTLAHLDTSVSRM